MIAKEALESLTDMLDRDGGLDEELRILDILDYLAILGIDGASYAYFHMLKVPAENAVVDPEFASKMGHPIEVEGE